MTCGVLMADMTKHSSTRVGYHSVTHVVAS
jgi:hypothetical protein